MFFYRLKLVFAWFCSLFTMVLEWFCELLVIFGQVGAILGYGKSERRIKQRHEGLFVGQTYHTKLKIKLPNDGIDGVQGTLG